MSPANTPTVTTTNEITGSGGGIPHDPLSTSIIPVAAVLGVCVILIVTVLLVGLVLCILCKRAPNMKDSEHLNQSKVTPSENQGSIPNTEDDMINNPLYAKHEDEYTYTPMQTIGGYLAQHSTNKNGIAPESHDSVHVEQITTATVEGEMVYEEVSFEEQERVYGNVDITIPPDTDNDSSGHLYEPVT